MFFLRWKGRYCEQWVSIYYLWLIVSHPESHNRLRSNVPTQSQWSHLSLKRSPYLKKTVCVRSSMIVVFLSLPVTQVPLRFPCLRSSVVLLSGPVFGSLIETVVQGSFSDRLGPLFIVTATLSSTKSLTVHLAIDYSIKMTAIHVHWTFLDTFHG